MNAASFQMRRPGEFRSGRLITRADIYLALGGARYSLGMLVGLLGLFVLAQVVDQLQDLGQGNYGLGTLAKYVLLSMPKMAYELIPLAVLLGAMAFLSTLASHSELVALRMAGWSLPRLARPLWGMAAAAGLLVLVLGEWVVPYSSPTAEAMRANALHPGQELQYVGGEIWLKEGSGIIRIEAVENEGTVLRRVMVLQSPSFSGLDGGYTAASAYYRNGAWHLRDVRRVHILPDRLQVTTHREIPWSTAIQPKTLRSFVQTADVMTLPELRYARQGVQTEGFKSNQLALAWWRRVTYPWVPLIMVAVVLPFAVRSTRGGGVAARLLTGLSLGLSFHFVNQMSGYISVAGGIPPWLSAVGPLVAFTLLAWFLLAKAP